MEKPPTYTPGRATSQSTTVPSSTFDIESHVSGNPQNQLLSPQSSPRAPDKTLHLPQVPSHAPGSRLPTADVVNRNRDGSASLDDPDDRTAAEALLGLGRPPKPEPPPDLAGYSTPLKYYPIGIERTSTQSEGQQPEPLLSLLTSSHPWLGGTLNGSLSAYSASKSYSPRFIRYGADLVENTVGTVGRKTGVEGSIRRYLDSRQPQDSRQRAPSRIEAKIIDPETARDLTASATQPSRKASGASVDTLPMYDENRSPAYEPINGQPSGEARSFRPLVPRSWSTQLMISTSGLGAALNENALKSLKFCLTLLSGANRHVRDLVEALKRLLQDYDNVGRAEKGDQETASDGDIEMKDAYTQPSDPAGRIAQRIKQLNAEIWQTFKNVVNNVNAYTGGALPENASMVVKWQLMSVPQRWHRAVTRVGANSRKNSSEKDGEANEEDAVHSANRMIEFTVEGLDMMEQVSGVVESTISSAERWLDSMGKRKEEEVPDQETSGVDSGENYEQAGSV